MELQRRKLTAILNYAYRNVRHYRQLFDSKGITPADIKNASDISHIPVTERHDIQRLPIGDITSSAADVKDCRRILTSGL